MFACGLILCELYTLRPLLDGTSEMDQILKMAEFLGRPDHTTWSEGVALMKKLGISLPESVGIVSRQEVEGKIDALIRGENKRAANLICGLIQWNPEERLGAEEALGHDYFGDVERSGDTEVVPNAESKNDVFGQLSGVTRTKDVGAKLPLQIPSNNDENAQWRRFPYNLPNLPIKLPMQNGTSRSINEYTEQPNEFCEYLNAVTSSDDVVHSEHSEGNPCDATQQIKPNRGPLDPKFTPSTAYKPRKFLSDTTSCKPNLHHVAQNISRTAKRRGRHSLNKPSGRKRTSEKPRWLLSNQNMGRRAIEVRIGHALHDNDIPYEAGQQHFGSQRSKNVDLEHHGEEQHQREPDNVWNPF